MSQFKVLHVTNAYPTKNIPVYGIFIKEQIESLNKLGFINDVHFINGREKGKKEYLKAYFSLRKIIKNYDIVHCHHVFTAIIVLSTMAGKKVVVSFLSDEIKEFINFPKFISKVLFRFVIQKSTARIFKMPIPPVFRSDLLSFHVPNGVNLDFFKPNNKDIAKKHLNLKLNTRYILFVSFYDLNRIEKRYDIFKKVINILITRYKITDVEELHMVNVNRELTPYYFNASEVHLLTSDFEGSPNSVKESLSCNTPVVSTNVGNVKEMLEDCQNCFIAQTNDPEEIALLIKTVLENKKSYNYTPIISKKGLDMESTAHKLFDIYNKVNVL